MPRGEPPFFTSNPGEKPGRQLRTRSTGAVEVLLQEEDWVEEELRCLRHYCRAEVPNAVKVLQEEGERVIQEILVLIAVVSAATNPSTEAVTEEVLDAVSAPAHDVPMEPSSAVFVKVKFFILILTLDLKCVL